MRKLTHDEISRIRSQTSPLPPAPLLSLLENIRSHYNVGSIFRTADGAGIQKLILTGYTPVPPRREIEKTALGATATVPWEYIKDPLEAVIALKSSGTTILALEHTDASRPYTNVAPTEFPICLILGNELTGVSNRVLAACDGALEISMVGVKHSLNVAVAYGIAVYELVRCWRSARSPVK